MMVVVLRIENGPAGPVIHGSISRRRSSLLLLLPPRALVVPSSIAEPIVFVLTVRLLLDQPLHLPLSSSTTRLRERRHIISTSVIDPEATFNILVNKKIAEDGLARLRQSLKFWSHLPIPHAE